ncbi:hypothetical protein [Endozoicomonas elysicola]|uniref:Uncharacterized protein n=1 Tax=Endozoicomonas elysicola TaxID=305900 RepID=A0A081K5J4_9GAMM|nr:hypothetical protein [Endozoicomonas elysicola]KEI69420.1 hypothetical protein GV64_00535 [Endozoicomonas elysicola]
MGYIRLFLRSTLWFLALATLLALSLLLWFTRNVEGPIPEDPVTDIASTVPTFIGQPHQPKPITAPAVPQHPFLARQGLNSMHNDSHQSDSYPWGGPQGHNTQIDSEQFHPMVGNCVSSVMDDHGRLLSTCVTPFGVTLVARDPETLSIIARKKITHWLPLGKKFGGGVYFHVDHQNRVLLASNSPAIEIWSLQGESGLLQWHKESSIDLGGALNTVRREDHRVIDLMPDWDGNYWFITRTGLVGVSDRNGQQINVIELNKEHIDNAMAVGPNGVFIASDHAMYRFTLNQKGEPSILWRKAYDRGSAPKPGTMGHGTGTTPTLIGNEYVAITDNADGQINVMVYKQTTDNDQSVELCKVPVFKANLGTSENSMVAMGNSLIVENNYGYEGPFENFSAEPGIARVDIDPESGTCSKAWENLEISSPSAVPKVSLANGLIYLYTRDEKNPDNMHAWYFTAVDAHTGQLVYKVLTGIGKGYNNHYGSISLMPDGTAYVGTIAGIVKVWDKH